ncbi:MAG: hypothetical protein D6677_13460 [Calditrichaeota bacterium]|nr:MAG: hypothetical protein D6677_13460 [Calditrichota bacterium]
MLSPFFKKINGIYDRLEHSWHSSKNTRMIGSGVVIVYLLVLLLIVVNKVAPLPGWLNIMLPDNIFYAINIAFTMLLFFEVISLVFALSQSVANAVGKQFEILSLIFIRRSFKEFVNINIPFDWMNWDHPLYHIAADALAALILFILIAVYYRIQHHKPIVNDLDDLAHFVAAKKAVALILLGVFILLGLYDLFVIRSEVTLDYFFHTFYTILIFSDILIVLISLRYCTVYPVVFRNSGFALSTAMIRIALGVSFYESIVVGMGAMLFTVLLIIIYNTYEKISGTQPT